MDDWLDVLHMLHLSVIVGIIIVIIVNFFQIDLSVEKYELDPLYEVFFLRFF